MAVTIRGPLSRGDEDIAAAAEAVLRALPDWFGIEASLLDYAREAARHDTWIATRDEVDVRDGLLGFMTLRVHFPHAAEIHCIAVRPEHHGRGIGSAMVEAGSRALRASGVEYLQVKTVGPSRDDPFYARTRRFYESIGFRSLEELPTLWNEANPCLVMVQRL